MCQRLLQIDEHIIGDHSYLTADDECYYLREYTAGQGFQYSKTNDLINNLKKAPDRRGRPEWAYKERAIEEAAQDFRKVLSDILTQVTLVPIPPSKSKDDPFYDDRMTAILQKMCEGITADIREFIVLRESIDASHLSAKRLKPDELEARYQIDENLCAPEPGIILIFDDVITAGAHFKACQNLLIRRFPNCKVIGIFIARRAITTSPDKS